MFLRVHTEQQQRVASWVEAAPLGPRLYTKHSMDLHGIYMHDYMHDMLMIMPTTWIPFPPPRPWRNTVYIYTVYSTVYIYMPVPLLWESSFRPPSSSASRLTVRRSHGDPRLDASRSSPVVDGPPEVGLMSEGVRRSRSLGAPSIQAMGSFSFYSCLNLNITCCLHLWPREAKLKAAPTSVQKV